MYRTFWETSDNASESHNKTTTADVILSPSLIAKNQFNNWKTDLDNGGSLSHSLIKIPLKRNPLEINREVRFSYLFACLNLNSLKALSPSTLSFPRAFVTVYC